MGLKFKDIQATIEIDLNKSEEELWNRLDKDARWGVNKARKSDLKVVIAENDSDWNNFYEIYKETIIRGGVIPKNKEELKSETDKLFLCFKEGKIIAGAAIKIKENKTELFLNASQREFLSLQPNNLLYWEIILWSKRDNYKIFDLGGYQLGTEKGAKLYEVNRFKERWGGEIKESYVYSKNPLYILGRKVIRNVHFVKRWRDKLKLFLYKLSEIKISRKLKRAFEKIIYDKREMLLYSIKLNDTKKIEEPKTELNLKLKKADKQDLEELNKSEFPLARIFEKRLENKDECFLVKFEEKTANFCWVTYREMNIAEISLKIALKEREACIYDCFTKGDFRGKGIYPFALKSISQYLKERKFKKAYIYVEKENIPSIKGIEKAGFRLEKNLKYKNIFGIKSRKK